ncbi:hypothetical protein O5817_27440, partial [Escherichia coli]|nr:hypothetical protein [Escherichia coli]
MALVFASLSSSATTHGFRQSTRVLAGMSLGFLITVLLVGLNSQVSVAKSS